jgi:hypothetical protein
MTPSDPAMTDSALLSPPILPDHETGAASFPTGGPILVLDPVCQVPGLTPTLLDRSRQFIGTDGECALRLPDSGARSRHAVIRRGRRHVIIKAFDPETWLNGLLVREAPLCAGDLLRVGPFEFRLRGATSADVLENVETAGPFAETDRPQKSAGGLVLRRARLATFRARLKAHRVELRRKFECLLAERAQFDADRQEFARNRQALAGQAAPADAAAVAGLAQSDRLPQSCDGNRDAERLDRLFRRPVPPVTDTTSIAESEVALPQPAEAENKSGGDADTAETVAQFMTRLTGQSPANSLSAAIPAESQEEATSYASPRAPNVERPDAGGGMAAAAALTDPQVLQPGSSSSSRRPHTVAQIRAGVSPLRAVANLSARQAIVQSSLRRRRRSVAVTLSLAVISGVLTGALILKARNDAGYYWQACGALTLGAIVLVKLAHSVWKLRNLDMTGTPQFSSVGKGDTTTTVIEDRCGGPPETDESGSDL